MLSRFLPLLAAVLVGAVSAQQTPPVFPAPPEVLSGFHLRAGAVQNLALPMTTGVPFDVRVVIADVARTLRLAPHDVRAPGFQLLVDDGTRLRQIPTPASVTYRGQVVGLPGSEVAASLIDGELAATIHLADRTLWAVQPLRTVNPALPRESHVVYRSSDVIEPQAHCGVVAPPHDVHHQGGAGPAAIKVCEIALDADLAYYTRFGSNTTAVQNQVTSVMNSVGVIYHRDVEIDYTITALIVRTTNIYTWTDISSLLNQFQAFWQANHGGIVRDTAHLFSGEGTFSGTIGLAFVGAICTTFGYGVSLAYGPNLATNAGLVAHELGHNWNAGHCDNSPPCFIMCSGIGGCNGNITQFDPGTINTILAFKNTCTCLSDPGGGGANWAEVSDAGETPSTAQAPVGTGALASISGTVATSGDVDMYLIKIVNEAAFSATTVGATPTLADTQLFLLDATGQGVVCNDDSAGGARSTIDSSLVTANGLYFLAVSGYDRDITNNGALIFANTTTGQIPPNPGTGPANGTTTGASSTGTYTIVLTGCEFVATTHAELGDAGDLLHIAQAPCQVGPLTVITGTNGANDVDLYKIQIDTPASFSASTCGGAGFDSQLFLLDASGRGVACNDDSCSTQSNITNALVTTPGVYYLAISSYNIDPVSPGGLIFPNTSSGQNGPTGPGGALPLLGWTGTAAAGGAYTITLTGCSHAAAAVAVNYGTGSGSAPGVPSLTTTFPPQLGNSTSLTLTNPDPTAAGMALVLGLSRTSLPLLGGTLFVGNLVTVLPLPAPAVGANPIGPFRLGRASSLCGSTVTWQAVIVVAPTTSFPTGLTWTNGTEWTFGL